MHADDFVINHGSAGQAVKGVAKCLPEFDTETATTLVIKAVYPVDPGTLVIASQDEKVFWVLDLVCEQETDHLKRLLAPVNIITEEKVVGLRWKSAILEQPQKIRVLPVNITTYLYGSA